VPLYASSSTYVFGGWLELRLLDVPEVSGDKLTTAKVPVVYANSPDTDLFWANDNALSTRDGVYGYQIQLFPSGGWYDTVKNLQAWYLYYDFSISMPEATDDLAELAETLPNGYDFAPKAALPDGQKVDVAGDKVSIEAQKLVKNADKYNDWANCTNAANVKVNFTRATGIVSGTFDLWYEGYNKDVFEQTRTLYTGLKHYGVFVPYRWDDGILENDVWTTGFFLAPQKLKYYDEKAKKEQTRAWTGSYRFDIKATKVDRDWSEAKP